MAAVLSGCISHVRALCFFMGVLSLSASWGWADSCLLAFYTFSSESDTPIELYSPVKLVPFQEYRPELGAEFSKHELEIQGEVVYEIHARDG